LLDLDKSNSASRVGHEEFGRDLSVAVNHGDFLRIRHDVVERVDRAGRVRKESGSAELSMPVVGLNANGALPPFVK
jgi:hypothetical protein